MIFSKGLHLKVLSGQKTQTRRLVKDGDEATYAVPSSEIAQVYRSGKLLWETYKTYAIQSGRGKKGDGHFRITKIRKETLQSMTESDARAEGVAKIIKTTKGWFRNEATVSFKQLWNRIHKKSGTRWIDNPEVWCISLEVIKEN